MTSQNMAALFRSDELLADRYRIIDVVGAGAMGAVYRALDQRLGMEVAIKVLHTSASADKESMQRFESELKLARKVSHPNVVRIHDIGEHNNIHFLTMDLVRGQSLAEIISAKGVLDPERVVRIAADVASGLAEAHNNGVVHRDLKPANILIDEDDRALITDFGVAKSIASARLTRTGMFVGTPDYLSPEQARGDEVDQRADIYALGLIIYEMLSGKTPSTGGSLQELIAQRTVGRTPDLNPRRFDAPEYLRKIILHCLEKNPADRYSNATQLYNDLLKRKASRRRVPAFIKWAAVVAVVSIAGLAAYKFNQSVNQGENRSVAKIVKPDVIPVALTLAILPFQNEPKDPALAWVSTGLVESLLVELTNSGQLDLVDMQRVHQTLADLHIDLKTPQQGLSQQLSPLLGADWILSGNLSFQDNQISIETVMQSRDANRPDIKLPPLTTSLADISMAGTGLADAIRKQLSMPRNETKSVRLSSNLNALRFYAMGVDLLTSGDSLGALEPLEQAIKEDPSFAAAWLRLGESYDALGRGKEAQAAIKRAVLESGEGNNRISTIARVRQAEMAGNYDAAREELKRVVLDQPGDKTARFILAELSGEEGHYTEAITLLEQLVKEDPNHPRAWFLMGKYSIQNGDIQSALSRYLVKALSIQEKLGNDQGKADTLNAMGVAHQRMGNLDDAQKNYARAAQIRERIGDQRGLASSLGNRARIELRLGKFDMGRKTLTKAIEVRTQLGDQAGLAVLYNIYGVLEEEAGKYRAALVHYRKALKIREELGDRRALGNSYNNIGFAYFVLGEYDNASIYWQKAYDESVATQNPDAKLQAEQNLGQLHLAKGEWNAASERFLSSLEASRELGFADAEAVSLGNLGRVAQRQGRFRAALSSYAEALEIVKQLDDPRGQIEFLLWRADTHLETGNVSAAEADINLVAPLLESSGSAEQRSQMFSVRGNLLAEAGKGQEARGAFDSALAAAADTGSDIPVMRILTTRAANGMLMDPDDVHELIENIRKSGDFDLLTRGLIVRASIALSLGETERAQKDAEELIGLLEDHAPYSRAWEIYQLNTAIDKKIGQFDQADLHAATMQAEISRLLGNIPEAAQAAFITLTKKESAFDKR